MKKFLLKNKILALLAVLTIMCVGMSVYFMVPRVYSSADDVLTGDDSGLTVTISSSADLVRYAQAYNSGNTFDYGGGTVRVCSQYDQLNMGIGTYLDLVTTEYPGIGTVNRPFKGSLYSSSGYEVFIKDQPFFNYVSTDFVLSDTLKIFRVIVKDSDTSTKMTEPLFAAHVAAGASAANWTIISSDIAKATNATARSVFEDVESFGAVIENIDGGVVNLNYKDDNSAVATIGGTAYDDNIGFVAGTLAAGTTLNVTLNSGKTGLSVVTNGGHAGGIVGEMGSGSTLKIMTTNLTGVTAVTTTDNSSYAGGIVGKNVFGTVNTNNNVYDISPSAAVTITGKSGAGGLFGFYQNDETGEDVTFTLEKYNIGTTNTVTLSGTGSYAGVGGVFGTLLYNGCDGTGRAFTFDGNGAAGSEKRINVTFNGGTYKGGVVGYYATDDLKNTFNVTDITTNCSGATTGGLIGSLTQPDGKGGKNAQGTDGATEAYVHIYNVTCQGSGTRYGGLVGNEGGMGSFIDVSGTVTLVGTVNGGLVGTLSEGVLRITGTTNLSGANIGETDGVIVKDRGRAIVYALGDGTTNWTLTRKSGTDTDDIYSWGQVIRVDGVNLVESNLFTVDTTAHTVTVKAAVPNMGTRTDVMLTAINIQSNNSAAVGALRFANAYDHATLGSSALRAGNLSLAADVNMSGTGFTGFMRDSGMIGKDAKAFTGTFSGNDHKITVDIGVNYGTNGFGGIHNHAYTGLFSRAGGGATVQDLDIDGVINLRPRGEKSYKYAGAVTAFAAGTLTIKDVSTIKPVVSPATLGLTINLKCIESKTIDVYVGGLIGACSNDAGLNVTIQKTGNGSGDDGLCAQTFNDNTTETESAIHYGGLIGAVSGDLENDPCGAQTVAINGVTVGGAYVKSDQNKNNYFGAAIGRVGNTAYVKDKRTITLTGLIIDGFSADAPVTSSGAKFGGVLGTEWLSADVTISGLNVRNTTIKSSNNKADFGGLVQIATGHWDVQSVTAASTLVYNVTQTDSTFGFVANKGYFPDDPASAALYLDVDNSSSNYNIGYTFTGSNTFDTYDEILATSIITGTITTNGQAIVSITTSGNIISIKRNTVRITTVSMNIRVIIIICDRYAKILPKKIKNLPERLWR